MTFEEQLTGPAGMSPLGLPEVVEAANPITLLELVEVEEVDALVDEDDDEEEEDELDDELVDAVMLNMSDWACLPGTPVALAADLPKATKTDGPVPTHEDRVGLVGGFDKVDLEGGSSGPSAAVEAKGSNWMSKS